LCRLCRFAALLCTSAPSSSSSSSSSISPSQIRPLAPHACPWGCVLQAATAAAAAAHVHKCYSHYCKLGEHAGQTRTSRKQQAASSSSSTRP
jgi:hypothetical protein